MFAKPEGRTSIRRIRSRLHQIEARREAIIAAVIDAEERHLYRHEYPDTAELEDLFTEADTLRQELDLHLEALRISVWRGSDSLQERRAREMARLRAPLPEPGPIGRLMARLAAMFTEGTAQA